MLSVTAFRTSLGMRADARMIASATQTARPWFRCFRLAISASGTVIIPAITPYKASRATMADKIACSPSLVLLDQNAAFRLADAASRCHRQALPSVVGFL